MGAPALKSLQLPFLDGRKACVAERADERVLCDALVDRHGLKRPDTSPQPWGASVALPGTPCHEQRAVYAHPQLGVIGIHQDMAAHNFSSRNAGVIESRCVSAQ